MRVTGTAESVDAEGEAMACGISKGTINALNKARRIVEISVVFQTA
jgi:hypothetical protein